MAQSHQSMVACGFADSSNAFQWEWSRFGGKSANGRYSFSEVRVRVRFRHSEVTLK